MAALATVGALAAGRAPDRSSGEIVALAPALKQTDDGAPLRWRPEPLTVHLDPSLARAGAGVPEAVTRGFGAWLGDGVALPSVRFVHATGDARGAQRDGKNTVSFSRISFRGHEHDLAITITYSDPATGVIEEADIVLNAEHDLAVLDDGDVGSVEPESSCDRGGVRGCSAGYDIESIVAHEVGHFFGLGEDREDPRATMFFCTSRCERHKRSLERSDSAPLEGLYDSGTLTTTEAAGCNKSSTKSTNWAE